MDSSSKVEEIEQAIRKLMEEVNIVKGGGGVSKKSSLDDSFVAVDDDGNDEDDDRGHLSRLLSQLETLKAEGKLHLAESEANAEGLPHSAASELDCTGEKLTTAEVSGSGAGDEEIIKELKKVRRQNLITHCLLSVMIVLTVAWQISEVSLILKLKDGVTHPFRSIGGMFSGMLKGPKAIGDDQEKDSSTAAKLIESSPLHDLKMPELPNVELPAFHLRYDDDE